MPDPVVTALTAGGLVIAGKWSMGKGPSVTNAVGIAGIALGLALIEQADQSLAAGFSVLILVSLAVVYLPPIVRGIGFSNASKTQSGVSHPLP